MKRCKVKDRGMDIMFSGATALGSALVYKISIIQSSDNGGLDNGACLGVKNIGKPCAGIGGWHGFGKAKIRKTVCTV